MWFCGVQGCIYVCVCVLICCRKLIGRTEHVQEYQVLMIVNYDFVECSWKLRYLVGVKSAVQLLVCVRENTFFPAIVTIVGVVA